MRFARRCRNFVMTLSDVFHSKLPDLYRIRRNGRPARFREDSTGGTPVPPARDKSPPRYRRLFRAFGCGIGILPMMSCHQGQDARATFLQRRHMACHKHQRKRLKHLAAVAFMLGSVAALSAADLTPGWREEVTGLRGGNFCAPPDELRVHYVFGWSGIEAAEARGILQRGADGAWMGKLTGGTKGWARSLWKLDADYSTTIAGEDWRSLDMRLVENYRAYKTDEKVEFLPGGVRSWRESTKSNAKPPKWRNFYVEGIRDIAGALLLARSQALRDGDVVRLAVFPGEWMYLVTARIEGREKIAWHGTNRPVIRASLGIESIEKDYSLEPHSKFQRGTVWVSDDDLRIPLRIEVKVFIGYVFAELVDFTTK